MKAVWRERCCFEALQVIKITSANVVSRVTNYRCSRDNANLSRLLAGRLKLGLLACLLDLLVLGQTVGVRWAHTARGLFFLAQDFAGTTGRFCELSRRPDLASTSRFWAPEKPGHRACVGLGQLCQVERTHLSMLLSSYSLLSVRTHRNNHSGLLTLDKSVSQRRGAVFTLGQTTASRSFYIATRTKTKIKPNNKTTIWLEIAAVNGAQADQCCVLLHWINEVVKILIS